MLFGGKHRNTEQPIISLHNYKLPRIKSTKFLGVYIDEKMTWTTHINEISKTISKNLGILNKAKSYFSTTTLQTLYYTLIYPHLTYGIDPQI